MKMKGLSIKAGGMYQEWSCLIDIVDSDIARRLNKIAAKNGWREIQPKEAFDMGFEELVNWSVPETDILVLIGSDYLVCLNKNEYHSLT